MKIRKNDKIKVITGKDRGKEGQVLRTLIRENKVLVEGVNKVKKHVKAKGKEPGGIFEIERPIQSSNVLLICPKCKNPTRVSIKIENKKKIRICRKCNETIV